MNAFDIYDNYITWPLVVLHIHINIHIWYDEKHDNSFNALTISLTKCPVRRSERQTLA